MSIPIKARFTFLPDRAQEFLEDDEVAQGRLVKELEFDSIEEVMPLVQDFRDALSDCNVLINGQVVNLTDFIEEV